MFYCGDCGEVFGEAARQSPCCRGEVGILAGDTAMALETPTVPLNTLTKERKPSMPRQNRSGDRTLNPWRPSVAEDEAALLIVVKRGEQPEVRMMKGPTDLLHQALSRMQPPKPRGRTGRRKRDA